LKAAQGQGGSSAEGKERKRAGKKLGEGEARGNGGRRPDGGGEGEGMRREGRGI